MVAFDEIDPSRLAQRVPLPEDGPAKDIFGEDIKDEPEQKPQPASSGIFGRIKGRNPKPKEPKESKESKSSISDMLGGLFDGQYNNNA